VAGALTVRPPERAAPLLLAAAALVLFTVALGRGSLWDQDEAKYTEVARAIVQRGDPITLYSNGEPWFVHPPLYMWLVAATGALFGFTELTARVWSALFGSAGVLVTVLLGRRLYDLRTGLLAGLILTTMLEYFLLSRMAVFDVPLVVFMLLALYMVVAAEQATSGPDRRRAYRWASVWAGLGTLTKGPIALMLPAMVLVVWWLLQGRLRERLGALPWEGLVVYGLIGLSWYGIEAALHGRAFLRTAVGYYMFNRFFGVVENQPGPWYYYLPVLAAGAFPWSALLPSACVYHWRRAGRHADSLLLLLWMGIVLLFYSVAGTKLPNYILPILPVAAVAVARLGTAALWEGDPRAAALLRWSGAVLVAVTGFLVLAVAALGARQAPAHYSSLRPQLRLLALPVAGGATVAAGLMAWRRHAAALAALAATMVAGLGVLVFVVLPAVEPLKPMKPLALALRAQLQPGDRIVGAGMSDRASLIFYSGRRVRWVAPSEAEVRRAICGPGRAFLVVARDEYDRWGRRAFAGALVPVASRGDVVALRTVLPLRCASP
jgi:4-amino-4-deoxy-L-arabinose transferase-like glycosyltransferase